VATNHAVVLKEVTLKKCRLRYTFCHTPVKAFKSYKIKQRTFQSINHHYC